MIAPYQIKIVSRLLRGRKNQDQFKEIWNVHSVKGYQLVGSLPTCIIKNPFGFPIKQGFQPINHMVEELCDCETLLFRNPPKGVFYDAVILNYLLMKLISLLLNAHSMSISVILIFTRPLSQSGVILI